jgi:hypothetical protein
MSPRGSGAARQNSAKTGLRPRLLEPPYTPKPAQCPAKVLLVFLRATCEAKLLTAKLAVTPFDASLLVVHLGRCRPRAAARTPIVDAALYLTHPICAVLLVGRGLPFSGEVAAARAVRARLARR